MSDEELKKLVESNAKAIQALADAVAQDREENRKEREEYRKQREEHRKEREEWRRDRARVFEWISRLAAAQADFYEMQADHLNHIEKIDDRLAEILDRLTPKN